MGLCYGACKAFNRIFPQKTFYPNALSNSISKSKEQCL